MKKYFLTGLAILLPAVLTIILFGFLINILTKPFVGLLESIFDYYDLMSKPFLYFTYGQILTFFSKIIILIALFLVTVFIGLLTKIVIFHYLIKFGNFILHRIPLVNKIYKAAQDAIKTVFEEKSSRFSQVVLVPFPSEDTLCLGLVTNEGLHQNANEKNAYGQVSVFIPATPNPTMGFVLLFKKEQIIPLKMNVEQALKFIVSIGVMTPDNAKAKIDASAKDIVN